MSMMSRFMDVFGKDSIASNDIPAEVLEHLNSELPENLMYYQDKNGNYMVVPRLENQTYSLKGTTELGLSDSLRKRLKLLSPVNWWTYFYRLQQPIPIKNIKIGNSNKVIPIEETVGNPLQESTRTISNAHMYPQKFPEPMMFNFESVEGAKISTAVQQQPYDSIAEIKFKNIDCPALDIELYCFAPLADDISGEKAYTSTEHPVHVIFSVFPTRARNVKEAVEALQLFKGLSDGTASINGRKLYQKSDTSTLSPEQTNEAIKFWSTLLEIEEKLHVTFSPSAPLPAEDIQFFNELRVSLIGEKMLTWKHPFDHFHMGGYTPVNEGFSLENIIGKDNISYQFFEGPIEASLLGTMFNLYSDSILRGFIITNIVWDDEHKEGCEVYIADAPGDVLTLSRKYITEEEYRQRVSKKQ